METLTLFHREDFTLRPDQAEILSWLRCGETLPCREAFLLEWDRAASLLESCAEPAAAAAVTAPGELTVLLTLRPEAEASVHRLFLAGEYMAGSLLNTLCDQMLFQMDNQVLPLMQRRLAAEGRFAADRWEPALNAAASELRAKISPMTAVFPWLKVSGSGTLWPTKSMLYGVKLAQEPCGRPMMLHDCARCPQTDCLYRKPGC